MCLIKVRGQNASIDVLNSLDFIVTCFYLINFVIFTKYKIILTFQFFDRPNTAIKKFHKTDTILLHYSHNIGFKWKGFPFICWKCATFNLLLFKYMQTSRSCVVLSPHNFPHVTHHKASQPWG